ncbi:MAG: hypothetical protein NT151_00695 [Acidobacteria bacterium]|nr:hypothetical protein [Acidobacteriota bacterium]
MTDAKSDDFDWVTARHQCSVGIIFERLRVRTSADVALRNKRLESEREVAPLTVTTDGASFSVLRGPTRVVRFMLRGETIDVSDEKIQTVMEATLTLNDAGECRLRVGDEELLLWQFLKRALETLFFG